MGWGQNIIISCICVSLLLTLSLGYNHQSSGFCSIMLGDFVNYHNATYTLNNTDTNTLYGSFPQSKVNPQALAPVSGGYLTFIDVIERIFAGILVLFNSIIGVYYLWYCIPGIDLNLALIISLPFVVGYTVSLYRFFRWGDL